MPENVEQDWEETIAPIIHQALTDGCDSVDEVMRRLDADPYYLLPRLNEDPNYRPILPKYDLSEDGINLLRQDRMRMKLDIAGRAKRSEIAEQADPELLKIVMEGRGISKPKTHRRF